MAETKKTRESKKNSKLSRVTYMPNAVRMSLESTAIGLVEKIGDFEREIQEIRKEQNKCKLDLQDIQNFLLGKDE